MTSVSRRLPSPEPRTTPTLKPWTGVAAGLVAAGGLLLGLVAGCGDGGRGGRPEAEFVFANRGKVQTLDPNQMSWMQDIRVAQALFEGVYTLDPITLDPIYGAAEHVEHSDDFTTWTIRLRENGRWSNGDPVTADDFIFAWRRMMREPGYYSYLVTKYVRGAEEYADAYRQNPREADFDAVGLRRQDDRTFVVELEHPTSFFPDLLAFSAYFPLHAASMERYKRTDAGTGAERYEEGFASAGNLVGNGSYVLTRWDQNTGQTLEMNQHYWDAGSVKSRTVRALDSDDFNLAFERYRRGLIDWISSVPGINAYEMTRAGRDDIHVFPAYGTYFWTFNTHPTLSRGRDNPLADPRVRRALSAAVDKEEIVETIARNGEMPATVFVPQNADYFPGYPHPTGVAYDVAEARRLLADAGFPNGQDFPRLSLTYDTDNPEHGQVGQNLARQWREKLGIQFDMNGMEHLQFRDVYKPTLDTSTNTLRPGNFDISRGSWYGDYLDVTTFTDMFLPTSLNNTAVWVDEEYAELKRQARNETDPQKRLELLGRAEQIFLDEAPILPLFHYTNRFVHRPEVTGIAQSPRNMIVIKNVRTPRSTGPGVGEVMNNE